jgi:hypothetical protein
MHFLYESLLRIIRCGLLVGNVPREVINERSGENGVMQSSLIFFWFLPTLFLVFIMGAFLLKKSHRPPFDFGVMGVAFGLWWMFPNQSFGKILTILNIQGVFHYFIFFAMGFFVSKYSLYAVKKLNVIGVDSVIISLCLFIFWPKGKLSELLMAGSGIVLSAWICYYIQGNKLSSLGKYSYQIYLFSWFPQIFIRIIFGQIFFVNIWLSVLLSFFLGLLAPIVVTQILNAVLNPKFRILYGVDKHTG